MEENNVSLEPIWQDNYTAIAMSSSDEYVPYLSVCLQSLVEHTSDDHNYDIIIFERSLTEHNKRILKEQICKNNISLRFINPMSVISQYNLKFPAHYNLECYFRLTSPLILKEYSKIIFTDVDLIFERDIKELYNIEVVNALGACQDLVFSAFLNCPNETWNDYARNVLELSDPYKYFNTGVMLLNLEYFRQNNISQNLLEMANEKMYRILEQDVLNKYFKDSIDYISDVWNFAVLNPKYKSIKRFAPIEFQERYDIASNSMSIIHWAGYLKPWKDPSEDFAYLWWSIARKTPYYEIILEKYIDNKIKNIINEKEKKVNKKIYMFSNYRKYIIEYWIYKILAILSSKKFNTSFVKKKNLYKEKIQLIKKIMKEG